jgi:hypothetical protein
MRIDSPLIDAVRGFCEPVRNRVHAALELLDGSTRLLKNASSATPTELVASLTKLASAFADEHLSHSRWRELFANVSGGPVKLGSTFEYSRCAYEAILELARRVTTEPEGWAIHSQVRKREELLGVELTGSEIADICSDSLTSDFLISNSTAVVATLQDLEQLSDEQIDDVEAKLVLEGTRLSKKFQPTKFQQSQRKPSFDDELPKSGCPIKLIEPDTLTIELIGERGQLNTKAQYNVIAALVRHFPDRLSKGKLVEKSGHTNAVNILKNVRSIAIGSRSLGDVVELAGKAGRGYGLRSVIDLTTYKSPNTKHSKK